MAMKTPLPAGAEKRVPFNLVDAEKLLHALAHPSRYRMMELMLEREWSVQELSREIGVSLAATSQHLQIMKAADILQTRRAAQTIYHSSCSRPAVLLMETMRKICT